jgi:hypothetical protein
VFDFLLSAGAGTEHDVDRMTMAASMQEKTVRMALLSAGFAAASADADGGGPLTGAGPSPIGRQIHQAYKAPRLWSADVAGS